ncbi:MAG: inorganic pyrophosphatase [Cytophagales bacterium]|nr:inorganic pyrophosphatase [Cytophagales bacterium]
MEITNSAELIGKIIYVTIDRPLGSRHPKHGYKYPVNYGYIKNTLSGDGEEIDAYILNISEPLKEFKGRCIAVIQRQEENDDKLVVVPNSDSLNDSEIRSLTHFQEKWFNSIILRKC